MLTVTVKGPHRVHCRSLRPSAVPVEASHVTEASLSTGLKLISDGRLRLWDHAWQGLDEHDVWVWGCICVCAGGGVCALGVEVTSSGMIHLYQEGECMKSTPQQLL